MEMIRNYLDTMFANLPRTLEVMRAKEELYSMMEDKYTELINEGKKENEAVGIVISEFGNLDELSENLGISKAVFEKAETDRRYITRAEADDYISAFIGKKLFLALGIMFCIFSPAGPILFSAMADFIHVPAIEGLGVGLMFICIAVGVGFIIFSSFTMKSWEFLKKELCFIDDETIQFVSEEKADAESGRGLFLTVGIMLCIISVLPVIILGTAFPSISILSDGIGPSMIFALSGVGVFFIIFSGARSSACKKLLSLNGKKTVPVFDEKNPKTKAASSKKAEIAPYNEKGTEKRSGDFVRSMVESYWKSVLCIYLIWSFLTMNWGSTWIIWPLAAILRRPIERYFGV